MAVPYVCSGKYTKVRATAIGEPTPPGNDSDYETYYLPNPTAIDNDYMTFSEVSVDMRCGAIKFFNSFSHISGTLGGAIEGSVTLTGYLPVQKAMGLHVGRRIQLSHDWSWTDPATSTVYDKDFDIVVRIISIKLNSQVRGAVYVNINAEVDERPMRSPTVGQGGYDWDYTTGDLNSNGYRAISLPAVQNELPWRV